VKDSGFDAAKWADGEVDIGAFRDCRSCGRVRCGLQTSPTSRWPRVLSISSSVNNAFLPEATK